MPNSPLMPKATAVWLVDNTSLTFDQIADFCGLHDLEVKGIADGDVAQGIMGQDPVAGGQLTRDEIERGQADPNYRLKLAESKVEIPTIERKRRPRYTPVSRRQDRPDAISWLLRNHPEISDGQIMKLVGTTKPTIEAIRNRTHWNSSNIKPVDPVTLGLCTQIDLDTVVQKAARRAENERKKAEQEARKAGTLLPVAETVAGIEGDAEAVAEPATAPEPGPEPVAAEDPGHAKIVRPGSPGAPGTEEDVGTVFSSEPQKEPEQEEFDPDTVFAKLRELKPAPDADAEDA